MMDTIYEKYQSLVPVVMFNEYFASGSKELAGSI